MDHTCQAVIVFTAIPGARGLPLKRLSFTTIMKGKAEAMDEHSHGQPAV
jgi:hypothetical protein